MKKILSLFIFGVFAFTLWGQTPYDTVQVYDPQAFTEMTTIDTANGQIISRKNNLNRRVNFNTLKKYAAPDVTLGWQATQFDTTGNAATYYNSFVTDSLGDVWFIDMETGYGRKLFDYSQDGIYGGSGSLIANTTVGGAYTLTFNGNVNSGTKLSVNNSGTSGSAISAYSTSTAINAQSISGTAGIFTSTNTAPILSQVTTTSTNTVTDGLTLQAASTGVGDTGYGVGISMQAETSSGVYEATHLQSRWTDATVGTHTSAFDIYNKNSAALERVLSLGGTGQLTLDGYAANAFNSADSALYVMATDETGDVWQTAVSGLGDGNGIYNAASTVAPVADMLVKLRTDSTFALAATNKTGYLNYVNTATSGDYFYGFYQALGTWGTMGMALMEKDSNIYQAFEFYDGGSPILTSQYGNGANKSVASLTLNATGTYEGSVEFSGQKNAVPYDYYIASTNPSTTSADTSFMVWIGNGTGADPSFIEMASISGSDSQTLSVSNDSLTISGGNTVRVSGNGFVRDSITGATLTVDLAKHNNALVVLKMESATSVTLTINNPWSSVSGSYPTQTGESGVYTFVFRGISGTDNVTWPANFYDMGGTALGTDALTAGTAYTCFYDPVEAKYYCK